MSNCCGKQSLAVVGSDSRDLLHCNSAHAQLLAPKLLRFMGLKHFEIRRASEPLAHGRVRVQL